MDDANRRSPQNQQQPQLPRLTDEEKRLLKECESESFWQRSLPLMVVNAGLIHYFYKKRGQNIKFYFVNLCMGAFFSYGLGKLSYLSKCREKLVANLPPDSELLKAMKSGSPLPLNQQQTDATEYSNDSVYDQLRKQNRGFQQPQSAVDSQTNVQNTEAKTYDQLRQQNREAQMRPHQQQQQRSQSQRQDFDDFGLQPSELQSPSQPSAARKPVLSPPESGDNKKKIRTNQYGDIVYSED